MLKSTDTASIKVSTTKGSLQLKEKKEKRREELALKNFKIQQWQPQLFPSSSFSTKLSSLTLKK